MNENLQNNSSTVFVGGISWKADEDSLREFFSKYGSVKDCKIILDRNTNKSKGYGFVTFEEESTANEVKEKTDLFFLGKMMNVGDAVRKSESIKRNGTESVQHPLYIQYGYTPYPYYSLNYHQAFFSRYGYPPPYSNYLSNYQPPPTYYPDPSMQGVPIKGKMNNVMAQAENAGYHDYSNVIPVAQQNQSLNISQYPAYYNQLSQEYVEDSIQYYQLPLQSQYHYYMQQQQGVQQQQQVTNNQAPSESSVTTN
eukprot:TRINITY_DN422_c0_g1_i1.p1 TRINITY_DN422_c0_g1~~TRINITY_DN422_c0_g1_i1.p1  ORF type:complete len:253 (+),score=75.69 TRINITY_DN422_c0_g1_i1:201-959(+)